MAFSSTIFILFSLATASTIAHALIIDLPDTVAQVVVVGRLVCTVDGNAVTGILDSPLAGANVTLSCNGGQTYLGQALTNTNGFYEVILNILDGLAFDTSECAIFVSLPVGNCTLLPPTGTLRAPASFLGIVPGALGSVAWFVAGLYEFLINP